MSNVVQINPIEAALLQGDLSRLSDEQRLSYYNQVCQSVGVNPLTRPFEYLRLNGKLVLYARRDATDQLRKIHKVSITKLETSLTNGVYTVTAYARDKDAKEDSEIGAVNVEGLKGDNLANAMMKASTKAKRRVTLSICGLGLLDESELETIPQAAKEAAPAAPAKPALVEAPKETLHEQVMDSLGHYVVPFGKHHGRKLKDIDPKDLGGYLDWLWKKNKAGEPLDPKAKELFDIGSAYMKETGY